MGRKKQYEFFYLGIILIFVSGICIGAWTTGNQQRGNFYSESNEDRKIKKKVATWSALAGVGSGGRGISSNK